MNEERDYWLSLPFGWVPLDLTAGQLPAQLRTAFAARPGESARLVKQRRELRRSVEALLSELRHGTTRFAAVFAAPGEGGPILASFTLTRHAVEAASLSDALDELAERRSAVTSLLDTPFVGPVVRTAYRERVGGDSLGPPAGRARRVVPAARPAEIAVWQYVLPVPGGDEFLIATGASPSLGLSAAFDAIFDAVLSTFQFVDVARTG